MAASTLKTFRESFPSMYRAMLVVFFIGVIAGTIIPLLLLIFTPFNPIIALVAYIGIAVGPILLPLVGIGVVALVYLAKAAIKTHFIDINSTVRYARVPAHEERAVRQSASLYQDPALQAPAYQQPQENIRAEGIDNSMYRVAPVPYPPRTGQVSKTETGSRDSDPTQTYPLQYGSSL